MLYVLLLIVFVNGLLGFGQTEKKIYSLKKTTIKYDVPKVADKKSFLNALMLSPYWKVEKQDDGNFLARARSVSEDFNGSVATVFPLPLFSFVKKGNKEIPKGCMIRNSDNYGEIIFQKPPDYSCGYHYEEGETMMLRVWDSSKIQLGYNSDLYLIFKLSDHEDIYLVLYKRGEDSNIETAFNFAQETLDEVTRIVNLPPKYFVKNIYKDFFNLRFPNLQKNCAIGRVSGIQDRDIFYGYFKTIHDTDYNGINIKVSHPKYCGKNGECTRDFERIRKAEYLGNPYFDNDLLYFQIEDNAIYLSNEKYDKMFGTFSGTGDFKGKFEILNEKGKVLYENFYQFKGWER